MLTNTILRQLFLCPTAASVPNPLLTRLAAMSLRLWGSSASPKRMGRVTTGDLMRHRCAPTNGVAMKYRVCAAIQDVENG